jgi:hypothetical protein
MLFNRPEDGSLDQLLIPTDSQRPDFTQRMLDVVERLAAFESRLATPILVDLLNFDADVLRFRVESLRANRGTLPLSEGIDLLEGARKSLLAAAHTALSARRHHPKLGRQEAVQLLEACQMGQTERGSFVVSILCPMRAVDAEHALDAGGSKPFARRATTVLVKALWELNAAIEENQVNRIVDQPDPLVSANLCEAILKMRPSDETGSLEFVPSWASSVPIDSHVPCLPISFGADEFDSIEDVYRQLLPSAQPTAKPWVATIDKLLGTEDIHGTREGDVMFTLFDDGETVRARASLTAEQYLIAHKAHNPSRLLVVEGELLRRPKVSRLAKISSIRLAQLGDIDEPPKM